MNEPDPALEERDAERRIKSGRAINAPHFNAGSLNRCRS